MKILMIGTGVIGTLTAITLSGKNQIDHYDLVIAAVNSYQPCNVIEEINAQSPSAKYLLMALNWKGTAEIDAILKPEQYILGYASGGGTYQNSGSLLWGNIGDDIMLGAVHDTQTPLLTATKSMFLEYGVKPEIPGNILHALWLHNIGTAPFGAALCKSGSLEEIIRDKALVKTCFAAMKECYQLAAQRGVRLKDFPETKMYSIPFLILCPLFYKNLRSETAKRYTAHASSAHEEMRLCFSEIMETARDQSVEMPNMSQLETYFPQ